MELNTLRYLYIANNAIHEIPSDIETLSYLQILSAYTNNIFEIPPSIGDLSNLYYLDFANNELSNIPETLCNIYDNLTVFYIGLNDICPPYPECLAETDIGEQDTLGCSECPDNIEGDVSFDGEVNILDVVYIINCILSDNCDDECLDLNFDSEINILDIIFIVNIILIV